MENNNVLWISAWVPYDKVPHAGGKIHNFYLKELKKNNKLDIKLITFALPEELSKIDLDKYDIDADIISYGKGLKHLFWGVLNQEAKYNPFNRYGGGTNNIIPFSVKNKAKKLYKKGYSPKVIILQWTQVVLVIDYLKRLWPNAKIISIEEDVFFLSHERKMNAKHGLKKWFWSKKFIKLKKVEIDSLNKSDLVILNNTKDEKLIKNNGVITKTWVWTPYFQNLSHITRTGNEKNRILFYGAMDRAENWKSAVWFIEKVIPLLSDNFEFVVIGNKPANELKALAGSKVKILGFVESIDEYFASSLCLVAPLVMGAGVKIKIIEALSAGLPVLTNEIGIEGINACDEKDYYFCREPAEYAEVIELLYSNTEMISKISNNARQLIKENYNYFEDAKEFTNLVIKMID